MWSRSSGGGQRSAGWGELVSVFFLVVSPFPFLTFSPLYFLCCTHGRCFNAVGILCSLHVAKVCERAHHADPAQKGDSRCHIL